MLTQANKLAAVNHMAEEAVDYLQFFGLSHNPFHDNQAASAYYPVPLWEEHLDFLQYLCNDRNTLLVVVGISGSGKTTLAEQLLRQMANNAHIASAHADTRFTPTRLLDTLAERFKLAWPEPGTLAEQLDEQLAAIQQIDKTCVLCIDDAHYLPIETLDAILYLLAQQQDEQMRLHIELFGEKELQDRLASLKPDDNLVHTIELLPLTLPETEEYLRYRLQEAGLQGESPFTEEELNRIYRLSGGIPGRINRIAERTLRNQAAPTKPTPKKVSLSMRFSKTHLLGALVLALAFAIIILFISYLNASSRADKLAAAQPTVAMNDSNDSSTADSTSSTTTTVNTSAATNTAAATANTAPVTSASTTPAATSNNQVTNTSNNPSSNTTANSSTSNNNNISRSNGTTTSAAELQFNSVTPAATPVASKPVTTPATSKLAATTVTTAANPTTASAIASRSNAHSVATPAATESVATTDEPSTASVASSPATVAAPISATPTVTEHSTKTVKHAAVHTSPSIPTTSTSSSSHSSSSMAASHTAGHNQAIMALNPKHFTLQLFGVRKLSELEKFVSAHQLDSKNIHIWHSSYQNKDWFVLLYGDYPSHAAAASAKTALDKTLGNNHAWIRNIGLVQNQISSAH